jgi:hypothetical protein
MDLVLAELTGQVRMASTVLEQPESMVLVQPALTDLEPPELTVRASGALTALECWESMVLVQPVLTDLV